MSFLVEPVAPSWKAVSTLAACLGLSGAVACAPQNGSAETESATGTVTSTSTNKVDILFMVDNSSSMTSMQQKMLAQIPSFIQSLQALPTGLPDLHLAVVSSDMGAPSDSDIGCGPGDQGDFQNQPRGSCVATTLQAGATFIADNADGTTKNFTAADPAGLASVFQCLALLGSTGCGFEHQLESVARALGADGQPPPVSNAGFLRADAELAIVFLTNEDDCSAPADTTLYSLNGGQQSLSNPLGPIANYRCNQFGHLCTDPTGASPATPGQPPLTQPADATGNPPTLTLTNCESNDSGLLTPVARFVAGIKALKAVPNYDIVVSAIMAPATPYTVEWLPGYGAVSNELWPTVEHSCVGANSDGSFGDPAVRIAQFVQAFGDNGVTTSVCDNSYQAAFSVIASKIGSHLPSGGSGTGGVGGGAGGASGHADGGFAGTMGTAGTMGAAGARGTAGTMGTGATTGTGGAAGTSGTGTAGTSGTGAAGTSGTGTAGTSGTGTAGTSGTGAAGTSGTGAAGTSGTGTGGAAATGTAGSPGTGTGGHAGTSAAGGAGGGLGNGGGCGCDTGGSPKTMWSLTLLIGILVARPSRRRR